MALASVGILKLVSYQLNGVLWTSNPQLTSIARRQLKLKISGNGQERYN